MRSFRWDEAPVDTPAAEMIRITDESSRAEIAEALEARTRRLMAERARLSLSWQTRKDRARLLGLVNDALDEWLGAQV